MITPEMQMRIDALKPWFHSIDLGDGARIQRDPVHGGDEQYPAALWQAVRTMLPPNFTGKRVLDVGCNSGFSASKRSAPALLTCLEWKRFRGCIGIFLS